MAFIIRTLFFLFAIFLFRWLVASFKKPPKKAEAGAGNNTNRMVKDPVCGMYMDARLAMRCESRSEAVYFCSEECKKKYIDQSVDEKIKSAAAN
jgi:uncharacterized protein